MLSGGPTWEERSAHHEAGHAVVAHLVGLPFDEVSIRPDATENHSGSCTRPVVGNDRKTVEGQMTICLAGYLAECQFAGSAPPATRDFADADRLSGQISADESQRKRLVKAARFRAEQLLLTPENWKAVVQLAKQLLATGRVGAADVERVMSS